MSAAARRLDRAAKQEQTRAALRAAAASLVAEQGLQATSIEQISAEAGFSRGAFYANYRSKQELFAELLQERVFANEKIEFVWNSEVADVLGGDAVTGLLLRDTVDGSTRELPVTGVFVAIGNDPRTHLVHDQLRLTEHGTVWVDGRSSRTSVAGVFAAGDVVDPTYRQAVTAAASGTTAALDVEHYLAARGDAGLPEVDASEIDHLTDADGDADTAAAGAV